MTREEMIESLRRCSGCGHTRDRHPSGGACAHVNHDANGAPSACACAGFVPGRLSAEGLRALHRIENVDGFIEALGPHPMEVP